MSYSPAIHHRRSIRLKGYDYSQTGMYFITICTHNRVGMFGDIERGEMILNEYGEIIKFTWFDLKNHNVNVLLDCFVIMPNHVHGIVMMMNNENPVGAGSKPAPIKPAPIKIRAGLEPAPTNHGLSEIMRQFKTFSAKRINKLRNTPAVPVWQRNFYEHVIRDEQSLCKIQEYIINNPREWERDELFFPSPKTC